MEWKTYCRVDGIKKLNAPGREHIEDVMAYHPDKGSVLDHHPNCARDHACEYRDEDKEYQAMGKGAVPKNSFDQP
nr:hypothetical protein [Salicibibacter cibarius]